MQTAGRPKYKYINRQQAAWLDIVPDELIGADHAARVIWELTSQLDLSGFESDIRSYEGEVGSPCWPPQLLLSVWLYGYQQGIASARELERRMSWEPGLRWLCGLEVINVHTLCDFRLQQKDRLEQLLAQLLTVLAEEKLVDLSTVVQDGTKIQARAGKGSAHRRPRLEQKLAQATAYMKELDAEAQAEGASGGRRQQAARQRAARERLERLQAALQEMRNREQENNSKQEPRVSESEPEVRRMRHSEHGGWMHSYNVQLTTEARNNIIVGVSVTSDQNDTQQLAPALETVRRFTGTKPLRMIADGGYVTRDSIRTLAAVGVELVAPMKDEVRRGAHARKRLGIAHAFSDAQFVPDSDGLRCPANQPLVFVQSKKHHGLMTRVYEASRATCEACPNQPQCCPHALGHGRRVHHILEDQAIQQHAMRMQSPAAQAWYRLRSRVAEFPHMRIKGNWGLRRFSVRGLSKVTKEALWMVLAFNFSQWMRARTLAQAAA